MGVMLSFSSSMELAECVGGGISVVTTLWYRQVSGNGLWSGR